MKYELIIDFETLGKNAKNCAVIDCSVMIFSREKFTSNDPYTLKDISKTKRFKLSVEDQVSNYKCVVEKDTLEFWQKQSPEVKSKILPKPGDLTVAAFAEQFQEYLIDFPNISYWWSRSNTFDPIILWRLFEYQGKTVALDEYLKYWRVRDTRTFIDAKLNFPKVNGFIPIKNEETWNTTFKQHDSSWDVLADVLRFQTIARAEEDLELL